MLYVLCVEYVEGGGGRMAEWLQSLLLVSLSDVRLFIRLHLLFDFFHCSIRLETEHLFITITDTSVSPHPTTFQMKMLQQSIIHRNNRK